MQMHYVLQTSQEITMPIPFTLPDSSWYLGPGIFSDTILSLIGQHSPTSIIYSLVHLRSISDLAEHLR